MEKLHFNFEDWMDFWYNPETKELTNEDSIIITDVPEDKINDAMKKATELSNVYGCMIMSYKQLEKEIRTELFVCKL